MWLTYKAMIQLKCSMWRAMKTILKEAMVMRTIILIITPIIVNQKASAVQNQQSIVVAFHERIVQ